MAPPGCMEALWAAVKGDRRASAARFYRLRLLRASAASSQAPVSPATPSLTAPPLFSERGREITRKSYIRTQSHFEKMVITEKQIVLNTYALFPRHKNEKTTSPSRLFNVLFISGCSGF